MEMRIYQWEKALKRFRRALAVDPSFKTPKENIVELRQYNLPAGYEYNDTAGIEKEDVYPQLHELLSPPEISLEELLSNWTSHRLYDSFFVVRNAFSSDQVSMNLSTLSFESLSNAFGDERADFYPHNMLEEQVHPFFLSLRESLRQLTLPEEVYVGVDASEPGTYLQWNMDKAAWDRFLAHTAAHLPSPFLSDHPWMDQCGHLLLIIPNNPPLISLSVSFSLSLCVCVVMVF